MVPVNPKLIRTFLQHWLTIHTSAHPCHKTTPKTLLEIEQEIFEAGIERGVLTSRGSWFRAEGNAILDRVVSPSKAVNGDKADSAEVDPQHDDRIYFRTTFAAASGGDIEKAIERFGAALRTSFGLESNGA